MKIIVAVITNLYTHYINNNTFVSLKHYHYNNQVREEHLGSQLTRFLDNLNTPGTSEHKFKYE